MATFKPRHYQQAAHDAAIEYIKRNTAPALLELATGAGKSIIVSMLARTIAQLAPHKKILCIAPSRELVEQNAEKYAATGSRYSIYCASAGSKCLSEQVIFASPLSLLKTVEKVAHMGVSAIIVDEAHGITKTVQALITSVMTYEINGTRINENCRVIGMTATPYRTGEGYIYKIDASGKDEKVIDISQAKKPYFHKLLYKITTDQLIDQSFLTPVVTDTDHDTYDTSGLQMDKGKFTADSVRLTFESDETKTAKIIQEVIARSHDRRGAIIFASTINHAKTILKLLQSAGQIAEIITGEPEFKAIRPRAIKAFKEQRIKFLVNVDILTTGFDAPHTDLVVIMRATESAGLLQQMIGRGLRLFDDKKDCLLLDYAENIDRHSLKMNLFEPAITAKADTEKGEQIEFYCPDCSILLTASRRGGKDYDGLQHDINGYFLLPNSDKHLTTTVRDTTSKDEFGCYSSITMPMPAHYMRRCPNPEKYKSRGKPHPCGHRFSLKICGECGVDNDIAARQCNKCKAPLVDVDEKLTTEAGKVIRIKNEFVKCYNMRASQHVNLKTGNKSVRLLFDTEAGWLVKYATRAAHWILNPIAAASGSKLDLVDEDYSNASLVFTAPPLRVKIKKEGAKIIVTGVSYEEE